MTYTLELIEDQALTVLESLESLRLIKLFPKKNEIAQIEILPKITAAEIETALQAPVIQRLNCLTVQPDWSWLPNGLKAETLTKKDIRELRLKERYGA